MQDLRKARAMTKPLAPEVRSKFAKRLKDMRVRSGFDRARSFAKALGIEENRYTRYERAEVEPSLTLIHKMCEILRVSPNELLGFAESEGTAIPGFSENPVRERADPARSRPQTPDLLAWRLASEVTASRIRHTGKSGLGDPLAATRETAKLFQKLERDPFATVAEIAADETLQHLDPDTKTEIAELITAYIDSITQGPLRATGT